MVDLKVEVEISDDKKADLLEHVYKQARNTLVHVYH